MMSLILSLAIKSLLVAGATLLWLQLARGASASQRSFIAHAGLAALFLLPLASIQLPALTLETGLVGTAQSAGSAAAAAPSIATGVTPTAQEATATPVMERIAASPFDKLALPFDWPLLLWLLPAIVLAVLTVAALLRLFALRARARVMVEPEWLSALAHAQRRMDFKSGAALLASDALPSPVSWGMARPVILLNEDALRATHEAEAIIAHELAHVASYDWVKLVLGRLVVAIYWFNPLVWMLARDAHQLREESADDAVLAANVPGADYAALLVHTARHDCKAALLGAHGVAPGKGSLQRRVRRVLDSSLPRTPMERRWAAIGALVALLGVAPLAALTLAPKGTSDQAMLASEQARFAEAGIGRRQVTLAAADIDRQRQIAEREGERISADEVNPNVRVAFDDDHRPLVRIDTAAIERMSRRAAQHAARGIWHGQDPAEYRAEIARAYPAFANVSESQLQEFFAIGVDPDDLRDYARAGFGRLSPSEAMGMAAVGMDADYLREIRGAGCRAIPFDKLTGMAAVGVDADTIREARRQGIGCDPDRLITYAATGGFDAEAFASRMKVKMPKPPRPARAPRAVPSVAPPEVPEPPEAPEDN
jgi:beta-lactamase regulating signal transducer with metallopeptidase domain